MHTPVKVSILRSWKAGSFTLQEMEILERTLSELLKQQDLTSSITTTVELAEYISGGNDLVINVHIDRPNGLMADQLRDRLTQALLKLHQLSFEIWIHADLQRGYGHAGHRPPLPIG